jgi:hypothetical protein
MALHRVVDKNLLHLGWLILQQNVKYLYYLTFALVWESN